MSARLGTPVEANRAAIVVTAVTSPTGNAGVLTLPTAQWCLLVSLFFQWVASASAGTRTISVLVKDSANNVLWQTTLATGLVAATTLNGYIGGAVPLSNNAGPPITFYSPIPLEFPIPPGCVVEVIDTAAISTADTCAINAVIVS
jgi:hypothetical protein